MEFACTFYILTKSCRKEFIGGEFPFNYRMEAKEAEISEVIPVNCSK